MGGRGGAGGKSKSVTLKYDDYTPYQYGRITKFEAGTIYRAVKAGNIKTKPETTRELYDLANERQAFAGQFNERYRQNHLYYDAIYAATAAINNNDFGRAQKQITSWENERIKRSTKKSAWYKYRRDT